MRSRISEYSVSAVATQARERGANKRDPAFGVPVDLPGDVMLFGQRVAHPAIGPPVVVAPHQQVAIDVVCGQFVGGQVDPLSGQVFVDVTQKIGELECPAQRCGIRRGLIGRADRAQNRKQLQANRFRGPLHVQVECGTIGIVGDRQIHPHRHEKVVEQFVADAVAARGVADRCEHRIG